MPETNDRYGVGFRPQHYGWVTTHYPQGVDVFEIVSENFMGVGGRPKFFLEKLRERYPIIMHGVALSIGSQGPLNRRYLEQLRDLANAFQPEMISDHLCWTKLGKRNSHDLLPIAYTQESLDDIVGKLAYIQDFLGRRFYLENPSAYVAFQDADYDEAGFFAELLKRSGAGILLDINNIYVNQRNLGLDPLAYFEALKPSDVGYFHLAGHSDQGDVLVDTHDHPVPDSVWALFARAQEYFPHVPAIVEWDGNIPDFPVLLAECEKARAMSQAYRPVRTQAEPVPKPGSVGLRADNLHKYSLFFEQIVRPFGISEAGTDNLKKDLPVPAQTGLKVYNHAYFLRLEEALLDTYAGLAYITEEEGFRYILAAYLSACPPQNANIRMAGHDLADFLRDPSTQVDYDFGVSLALLGDLAALEWARSEAFVADDDTSDLLSPAELMSFKPEHWESTRFQAFSALNLVACSYDVLPALSAIDREETPDIPDECPSHYVVYRQDFAIHERSVAEDEAKILGAFAKGASLREACDALTGNPGFYESEQVSFVASKLMEWSQAGWIKRLSAP